MKSLLSCSCSLLVLVLVARVSWADCTLTPNLSICQRNAPDKYTRADYVDFSNKVDLLVAAGATGHKHTGVAGQGPKLDITATLTGILPAAQFPALTGDVTTVAGALATT